MALLRLSLGLMSFPFFSSRGVNFASDQRGPYQSQQACFIANRFIVDLGNMGNWFARHSMIISVRTPFHDRNFFAETKPALPF